MLGDDIATRVLSIFPRHLPLLRFLSVSRFDPSFYSHFSHCTALAEVELSDHIEERPFFPSQDLARVKILLFINNGIWVACDILYIARFTSLEVLALSNGIVRDAEEAKEPKYSRTGIRIDEPLQLPHLRILTVRGTVPKDILLQLAVPSLRELLIEDGGQGRTFIHHLYTLFPPSCQQIRARLSPMAEVESRPSSGA